MYWDILKVNAIAPRTLEVIFSDGLNGKIFIDCSFCTGVFEALLDDNKISTAFVENGVMTWSNGLDLAPDTMYREIKNSPERFYVIKKSGGLTETKKTGSKKDGVSKKRRGQALQF